MVKDVSSQHRVPDTVPAAMLSATMVLSLGDHSKQTLSGMSFLACYHSSRKVADPRNEPSQPLNHLSSLETSHLLFPELQTFQKPESGQLRLIFSHR